MQDGRRGEIEQNDMEGVGENTHLSGSECAVMDDSFGSDGDGNTALPEKDRRDTSGMYNGVGNHVKGFQGESGLRRSRATARPPYMPSGTNGDHAAEGIDGGTKALNGTEGLGNSNPAVLLHESRDKFPVNGEVAEEVVQPAGVPLKRTSGQIEANREDQTQRQRSDGSQIRDKSLSPGRDKDGKVLKLSPAKIHELTSSPESLCLRAIPADRDRRQTITLAQPVLPSPPYNQNDYDGSSADMEYRVNGTSDRNGRRGLPKLHKGGSGGKHVQLDEPPEFLLPSRYVASGRVKQSKSRAVSSPGSSRRRKTSPGFAPRQAPTLHPSVPKSDRGPASVRPQPEGGKTGQETFPVEAPPPAPSSPVPMSIPLPPFSLPTYLQLELSSERPSPLYIHQSVAKDFPYESSRAKLERLQNFLLLPPLLEQVLCFGTLACLDSWLYSFTIFPLRFGKSVSILLQSWFTNLGAETQFIYRFVVAGVGRVWERRRRGSTVSTSNQSGQPTSPESAKSSPLTMRPPTDKFSNSALDREAKDHGGKSGRWRRNSTVRHHRRTKSIPSDLMPDDKADILKGSLMISTCVILMYFDASRVYHWIRGQAAIKLYVIYNVLEVGDRLFSAIGQDVLECLFSREALERKPDGRSKVLRPFWLFILALVYTVIHSTALFYQVMTLNVAVNSYSNALMTLLLSNQFVEIKSTVFKKFEKENLFQLTCADVVERFQLWLMLLIIACRNLVETGAFSFGNPLTSFSSASASSSTNSTPPSTTSILPQSFTLLPSAVFSSLNSVNSFLPTVGQVLGPFLVVLGSEMLVDWLKHAYINKFNNYRPSMYGRFLDILAKDYYTNAFGDQNLNRRLGLPIIPLSCLFFRVSVQTYQMFLTSWLPQSPSSFAPSNTTSLSSIHSHYSPSPPSAAESSYPSVSAFSYLASSLPTSLSQISALFKSLISHAMPSPAAFVPMFTIILILLLYVTLLLAKLVVGMVLLSYARARYKSMKSREKQAYSSSSAGIVSGTADANPASSSRKHSHSQQMANPQAVASSQSPSSHQTPTGNANDPGRPAEDFVVEGSRRVGGWGAVEVGDERRNWIYADDPEGLRALRERDERTKGTHNNSNTASKGGKGGGIGGIEGVRRYEMVAKRIW